MNRDWKGQQCRNGITNTVDKKEDGYYVNGKKTRRVTDLVSEWYDRRFGNRDLTDTDYEKAVFDLKAEKGTDGHKDKEYAFSIYVDENGYLRDTPLDDSTYDSFSIRFTESTMKRILQALFSQKPYYLYDILECILVKEG